MLPFVGIVTLGSSLWVVSTRLPEADLFVELVELMGLVVICNVADFHDRFILTHHNALLAAMDEGLPTVLEVVSEM